ncbi:hypothetical protein [Micromonospora sp. NPDC005291]|uniref:hypothetical protein n=1 Tax=Micromonospora sp. NPDC005291 TaxID=3156872 RepID=UPI0033A38AFD
MGTLRLYPGRYPDDPQLNELVGELTINSTGTPQRPANPMPLPPRSRTPRPGLRAQSDSDGYRSPLDKQRSPRWTMRRANSCGGWQWSDRRSRGGRAARAR